MVIVLLGVLSSLVALNGLALRPALLVLLTMGVPALAAAGELIAFDARSTRQRTFGLSLEALCAAVHIALQLGALRAPWIERRWELIVALSAANIVVMGLALRFALRSLALDAVSAPADDLRIAPRSLAHRIERELSLFGGTAVSFTLCSAAFVLFAARAIAVNPALWSKLLMSLLFFTVCAITSVKFGLDRRATQLAIARTRA